jgi:tRNA(fMet)-specific endonuclease VapC
VSWLLDTNACINLMKLREPLLARVREAGPGLFAVSAITCAELWYGAVNSRHPQRNRADQDAFLEPFRILDFDAAAADRYAVIRGHLSRSGRPIGDRDLMIASIAVANRMAVITSDTGEFSRVPGLQVEDWMVPPSGRG